MRLRIIVLVLTAAALVAACGPRATPAPPPPPEPTATPLPPADTPTAPALPTVAAPLATMIPAGPPVGAPPQVPVQIPAGCTPQVTATTVVNVRNGPTTNHAIIGSLNAGETAKVDGKNADGTWWYIVHSAAVNGHGWVSGGFVTTSCLTATLPVIDASNVPGPFVAAVTDVIVSVDPSEEYLPACEGDIHWFTVTAVIRASGPMQVTYAFEIEGAGTTPDRTISFSGYGERTVTERFRPQVVEGRHVVRLWITGLDMRTWEYQAWYRIKC